MKTKLYLLVITFIAFTLSTYSIAGDKGEVGSGGLTIQTMRAKIYSPISTDIQHDNINAYFNINCGIISASIKNEYQSVIYKKTIDTNLETSLKINISNLPEGTYTLIFTNSNGVLIKSEKFTID